MDDALRVKRLKLIKARAKNLKPKGKAGRKSKWVDLTPDDEATFNSWLNPPLGDYEWQP